MNRIDRLLGYILTLQGARRMTAAELAARFEVSARTVYRDLEALAELGVPIVATPGHGYALEPGYHLPPVMLSAAEASALALAGGLFRHFVAYEGRVALDAARLSPEHLNRILCEDGISAHQDSILGNRLCNE